MSDTLNTRNKWITPVLIGLVIAIFLVSLIVGNIRSGDGEAFGGTDDAATQAAEESGAEPWFTPLFEPAPEVESGLFAIQAAIGSGIIFFCLGRMSGKRHERKVLAAEKADESAVDGPSNHQPDQQNAQHNEATSTAPSRDFSSVTTDTGPSAQTGQQNS